MSRRRRLIVALSGAASITLAVVLIVTLTGNAAPVKQASGSFPYVAAPTLPHVKVPPRPKGPLRSPFTGERIKRLGPELVVKIDNIVYARPQTGLQSADIVYVLPVEGGLSRFEVVFSSRIPKVIGPVRSAREDDLELLRQFGRPAFAFSGAAPHLLPFIERARIVDLYAGINPGYFRSGARIAPYNLFMDPKVLMPRIRHASKARDIGFRFGKPPAGGRARGSYSVAYPAARYTFRWSAKAKRYLVWIDGSRAMATEGGQLGGKTVVIQYTTIRTSRFREYGFLPPFAQSDGHGRAVVLRNGRAYNVHWSRPLKGNRSTVYTLPNGKRMTFTRGQVWVIFAGKWPRNSPG